MTQDEVLQIFRDSGALLEGHFILRSGLHSRQFFQCALALQQMPVVEKLGAALADKVRKLGAVTVIAPALGGLVIGQEVARQLGVRFIFPEKEDGKLVLRRGFKIAPGEKMLVVEDVVTKGGRVQETIDIVRAHGGNVAGIGAIVDRSNGTVNFGVPFQQFDCAQSRGLRAGQIAAGSGKNPRRQTGEQINIPREGREGCEAAKILRTSPTSRYFARNFICAINCAMPVLTVPFRRFWHYFPHTWKNG